MQRGYLLDEQSLRRLASLLRQTEPGLRGRGFPGAPLSDGDRNRITYTWKNEYSTECPAGGVIKITNLTADTYLDRIKYLNGTQPDTTFQRVYACNGPYPVAYGSYGQCYLEGMVEAAYDTGTPAIGDGWGPKPGQWTLAKDYPATADVYGLENSTDKKILVDWHPLSRLLVKLDATLSQGGSAYASVYRFSSGTRTDITGWDITVCDMLMKSGATAIALGKYIWADYYCNTWSAVSGECA